MKKLHTVMAVGLTAVLSLSMIGTASAAEYTVAKGDSLWKIAKAQLGNGSRWTEIYDANRDSIKNPNLIYAGQVLNIGENSADTSATPTVTEKTLSVGSVTIYDYGTAKLHAYSTGDALGDTCYIVEGKDALVGIELPSFTDSLDVWSAYVTSLGKPMNDIFVDAHATGASYVTGMTVYGTQAAKDAIASGSTFATTQGLFETFGEGFHGGDDMVQINKVVSGTVTVAGITFNVIDAGDDYDLEIPSMNVVYTHMLGKTSHSILASVSAMDTMLNTLRGYQKAGYSMVLSGHSAPEGQDAVTEKIAYVEKAKALASSCTTADAFTSAMQEAFPNYVGESYLQMTAGFLYPNG